MRTQGTINIIWAVGRSDDYLTKHADVGGGVINMEMDELLLFGAPLVALGAILRRSRGPNGDVGKGP